MRVKPVHTTTHQPGRPRLSLLSLLIGSMCCAGFVHADEAVVAAAAVDQSAVQARDIVVVTGARGAARSIADSLSPIDVVGSKELAGTGKQNLRDALSTLYPSYSNTPGFKGQTGIAVATATLRGLDANSVLVLVNGKRRHKTPLPLVPPTTSHWLSCQHTWLLLQQYNYSPPPRYYHDSCTCPYVVLDDKPPRPRRRRPLQSPSHASRPAGGPM